MLLAEVWEPPHWAQVILYTAGATIVIAAFWTKVVGPWFVRPLANMVHQQMTEAVDAQTVLIRARQEDIEKVVGEIRHEVTYNGGGSLKDVVRHSATQIETILALLQPEDSDGEEQ